MHSSAPSLWSVLHSRTLRTLPALPSVFLGLAALRSVSVWMKPFVCAVPSIFSLCSSQGFRQRLEGQCCFSALLCTISTGSLSILRVCVFTDTAMVHRHLVAGNAGTAGWCPRACSDIPHDQLSSNSSVFAHPIRKHYQTFKGTQPHNGHFFRHFELLSNLSSLWIFLKVPFLHTGCPRQPIAFAHPCVSAHGCLITLIYTISYACPWSFILLKMWKLSDSAGYFHSVCKTTKQFLSLLW